MNFLKKSSLFQLTIVLSAFLLFQGCSDSGTNVKEPQFNPPPQYDLSKADTSYTTDDGLQVYIIEEGYGGFEVIPRDQVTAKYTGYTMDGKVFDSTFRNDQRTGGILRNLRTVPISSGNNTISPLIDGFRRGILGMVEGEKRTVIIPPELGYGEAQKGTNGFDLRNDTLRFDIELVNIF